VAVVEQVLLAQLELHLQMVQAVQVALELLQVFQARQ